MAKIDNKTMKVMYAVQPGAPVAAVVQNAPKMNKRAQMQQQPMQQANRMPARRRANNRIAKSGQGRTLNVMGQRNRAANRRAKANKQ